MSPDPSVADRVGISTISFRHRPLPETLRLIAATGAERIDLGAIPDVTNHVPVPFTDYPHACAQLVEQSGLRCGAVNADPGDLNDPELPEEELLGIVRPLISLAAACGAALIVPAGRADDAPIIDRDADLQLIAERLRAISRECSQQGVRLLVEVLHHRRFVHTVEDAERLLALCGPDVFGTLFDVSHVVASADDPRAWIPRCAHRIERVHLRDAVPGDLNLSIDAGQIDFAAVIGDLENHGFTGTYILELETHDVAEHDRERDVGRSYDHIVHLLDRTRR